MQMPIFRSFFQGGFECSTHRYCVRGKERRLDLIGATQHDRFVLNDYRSARMYGMTTVRDGIRWHLIEKSPGQYDFSSWVPMLEAAQQADVEVIWDLFHFGWPDDIDIFTPEFVDRFATFANAAARILRIETSGTRFVAPTNEISFLSWAGGDKGFIFPHKKKRADELKRQLVRAAIAGIKAVRTEIPDVRLVHPEPVIHIVADPGRPRDAGKAEGYRMSQFQAWDMMTGRMCPELGGADEYLDIVGVNFYDRNEWIHNDDPIPRDHPLYRPFQDILMEVYERYRRPMMVAETGTEDEERPAWLRYVADQVRAAMERGIPMHGICLYPVVNHPGWVDNRHCCNGLFDYASEEGVRPVYQPLAAELERQQEIFMNITDARIAAGGTFDYDVLCLSHLRWQFVFQRPQHLMSRFAKHRRVFFVEEPVRHDGQTALHTRVCPQTGVHIVVPFLANSLPAEEVNSTVEQLLLDLIQEHGLDRYLLWYYTPMAMDFSASLKPLAVVYDCMDELSAFRGAPPALRQNEAKLLKRADLVFTGGMSLFEAKAGQHPRMYPFPSGVDVEHFKKARLPQTDPEDQASIPHPRFGFAAVIDERFDIDLVRAVSELRPDWHFVILGPVVKIDPATLPQGKNVHYLGGKDYRDLPAYLSGWDVALLLFARNESTRFISPTKTPEYLAAGKPTVSTSIRDVVRPYKELGLVQIADEPAEFVAACERALALNRSQPDWLSIADEFLMTKSWDSIWGSMDALIQEILAERVSLTDVSKTGFRSSVIENDKGVQECSIS